MYVGNNLADVSPIGDDDIAQHCTTDHTLP